MRVLAAVLLLCLTGCTTAFLGTPAPEPPKPGDAVLLFRPVLAVSAPTAPDPTSGVPSVAPSDPPAQDRVTRQDPKLSETSTAVPTFTCPRPDPLAGRDDPALPLLTCGPAGDVYVLGPAALDADDVEAAQAQPDPNGGGHVIEIRFTVPGRVKWTQLTTELVGRQLAIVVNTSVVSAPNVHEPITGGVALISGGFTKAEAEALARSVKGG